MNFKKIFNRSFLFSFFLILAIAFFTFFYIKGPKNYAQADTLPNTGIVIFTFDDTYKSTYTKAYPVLANRGWQAVAYINPSVVGLWQSKMTLSDLTALNNAEWDVSSHGYTHVDPTTMTSSELDDHLRLAHDWLVNQGFTNGARHYASPNGGCNSTVTAAAQTYYDTMRINGTGCGFLPSGYTYTIVLGHDAVPWSVIQQKIDNLQNNTQVLFIAFHDVVDSSPINNQTSLDRLNQVFDYVTSKNINVLTLSDLIAPTPTPTETPTPTPTETPTPTPTPIPDIIIDNLDSSFSTVGTWGTMSNSSLLHYSSDFTYTASGSGTKKAIFTPNVTTGDNYEVFVWWPQCWVCATNATYTITHANGTSTVVENLNDRTKAGQWNSMGVYSFNSGTSGNVTVTNYANGRVTADALKLVAQ